MKTKPTTMARKPYSITTLGGRFRCIPIDAASVEYLQYKIALTVRRLAFPGIPLSEPLGHGWYYDADAILRVLGIPAPKKGRGKK